MSTIAELIGQAVEKVRKEKHISQESLAKMLGVSRQSVGAYEKGERLVNSAMLNKLARALGVEETDLFKIEKKSVNVELKESDWQDIQKTLNRLKLVNLHSTSLIPAHLLEQLSNLDEVKRQEVLKTLEKHLQKVVGEQK